MNYLIFIIFTLLERISGLELLNGNNINVEEPKCFHFSWLGPTFDNDISVNCSAKEYKKIPCVEPFEISVIPPNITDMWTNKNRSEITCLLQPGYSCIKYTYSFNKAIVNSTYFCGKMIEGMTNAMETGCFVQKIGGHIIEACACRSTGFGMPCNLSIRNTYSALTIMLLTLFVNLTDL